MKNKQRQTQTERTQKMRDLLCKATLDVISDIGYEKTTTTLIAERAGVSRGAQTHHFPTKFSLVDASFKYLLREWERKRKLAAGGEEMTSSIADYVEFLWRDIFGDPQYVAALELMLAARGDKNLRGSLVKALNELSVLRRLTWQNIFSGTMVEAERDIFMNMTICLLRGLSMQDSIEDTNGQEEKIVHKWIEILVEKMQPR